MYNVDLRQLKGTEPTLRRPEAIRIIAGYFRISNELARQYLREILPDGTANGKGGGYLYIPCRLKELIVDIRDGGDGNQEPDIETAESPVDSALKVSYTAPDNSVRSDASNPVHAPEAKESLEIRARSKRAPDNLEYHKGHNPAPEYALPRFDDWESARDWSKKGEQATPYSDLDVAALHISHRYNLEITEKQLREFCDHNDIYCIGKRTGKKYVLDTTLHYAVLFGLLDRFMRYKPDESDAA
ncbi:MAG: hypothetical protein NT001_01465, partial [Candidatus Woesearchaeota archaeon]|nr:hypothetical protein [Candidatus Woesearchaeota archaeon]